ncbi:MAG: type II secretion system protein N [Pseudomonadota bacterium]
MSGPEQISSDARLQAASERLRAALTRFETAGPAFGRFWRNGGAGRLAACVEIGLVIAIAYVMAGALWTWSAPAARQGAAAYTPAAAQLSASVDALTKFDPFHRPIDTADGAQSDAAILQAARETTLNLELFGIRADEGGANGVAVIKGVDNQQGVYAVGEEIPGTAETVSIRRILPDRVILSRAGVLESLYFHNADPEAIRRASARTGTAQRTARPERTALQAEQQSRIFALDSADEWLSAVAIRPRLDGAPGFVLAPGASRAVFDDLGLQQGDILLSVNGARIEGQESAIALAESLRDASSASVVVERNGAPVTLSYRFE